MRKALLAVLAIASLTLAVTIIKGPTLGTVLSMRAVDTNYGTVLIAVTPNKIYALLYNTITSNLTEIASLPVPWSSGVTYDVVNFGWSVGVVYTERVLYDVSGTVVLPVYIAIIYPDSASYYLFTENVTVTVPTPSTLAVLGVTSFNGNGTYIAVATSPTPGLIGNATIYTYINNVIVNAIPIINMTYDAFCNFAFASSYAGSLHAFITPQYTQYVVFAGPNGQYTLLNATGSPIYNAYLASMSYTVGINGNVSAFANTTGYWLRVNLVQGLPPLDASDVEYTSYAYHVWDVTVGTANGAAYVGALVGINHHFVSVFKWSPILNNVTYCGDEIAYDRSTYTYYDISAASFSSNAKRLFLALDNGTIYVVNFDGDPCNELDGAYGTPTAPFIPEPTTTSTITSTTNTTMTMTTTSYSNITQMTSSSMSSNSTATVTVTTTVYTQIQIPKIPAVSLVALVGIYLRRRRAK